MERVWPHFSCLVCHVTAQLQRCERKFLQRSWVLAISWFSSFQCQVRTQLVLQLWWQIWVFTRYNFFWRNSIVGASFCILNLFFIKQHASGWKRCKSFNMWQLWEILQKILSNGCTRFKYVLLLTFCLECLWRCNFEVSAVVISRSWEDLKRVGEWVCEGSGIQYQCWTPFQTYLALLMAFFFPAGKEIPRVNNNGLLAG